MIYHLWHLTQHAVGKMDCDDDHDGHQPFSSFNFSMGCKKKPERKYEKRKKYLCGYNQWSPQKLSEGKPRKDKTRQKNIKTI